MPPGYYTSKSSNMGFVLLDPNYTQLFSCDFAVVPRQLLSSYKNTLFVTLPGQQDSITRLRLRECCSNGLSTVCNAEKIPSFTFANCFCTFSNVAQNTFTILFTRIFISNNEKITHLCGNTPHHRTFLYITLTSGTKYHH